MTTKETTQYQNAVMYKVAAYNAKQHTIILNITRVTLLYHLLISIHIWVLALIYDKSIKIYVHSLSALQHFKINYFLKSYVSIIKSIHRKIINKVYIHNTKRKAKDNQMPHIMQFTAIWLIAHRHISSIPTLKDTYLQVASV